MARLLAAAVLLALRLAGDRRDRQKSTSNDAQQRTVASQPA